MALVLGTPAQAFRVSAEGPSRYSAEWCGHAFGALEVRTAGDGVQATLDLQEDWGSLGVYGFRQEMALSRGAGPAVPGSLRVNAWGSGLATQVDAVLGDPVRWSLAGEGSPLQVDHPASAVDLVLDFPYVPYLADLEPQRLEPGAVQVLLASTGQVVPAVLSQGPVESLVREDGIFPARSWLLEVSGFPLVRFWREEATGRIARAVGAEGTEFVFRPEESAWPPATPLPRRSYWSSDSGRLLPLAADVRALELDLVLLSAGPFPDEFSFDRDGRVETWRRSGSQDGVRGRLSVRRTEGLVPPASPFQARDPLDQPALPYLEATAPEIREAALEATAGAADRGAALQGTVGWLRSHVRTVVAWPSARRTLATRAGDFRGKALLGAAMLRSVGVPARVVGGLVLDDRSPLLEYRQWVEAEVSPGRWSAGDPEGEPGSSPLHLGLGPGVALLRFQATLVDATY